MVSLKKEVPFYLDVTCTKARGGERALWHARKVGYIRICGAGNTAENAIKDLQKQCKHQDEHVAAVLHSRGRGNAPDVPR